MAAFMVANFEITNPEGYRPYLAGVLPTLEAFDAEIVVADYGSETLEGNAGSVTVVVKFDSKEKLDAWYASDAYQQVIGFRQDNSEGILVAAGEFDLERTLRILKSTKL